MKQLILAIALLTITSGPIHASDKLYVYSAASMTNAIKAIIKSFESAQQKPVQIRVSFAASSTLARQIAAGAPAGVFISANKKWMNWLNSQGLLKKNTVTDVASNSLVLISASDTQTYRHPNQLKNLVDNNFIALGNYNHVPAGMYAKESLETLKLWDAWKNKLVLYPDVVKALNSVSMGQSEYGIVYQTDAASLKNIHMNYRFPAKSHRPIVYPAALISNNYSKTAEQFLFYLKSESAIKILKSFGFVTLK